MTKFYKIVNNDIVFGSGEVIPNGFKKYDEKHLPKDLKTALNKKQLNDAIENKIDEINENRNNEVKNMIVTITINKTKVSFNADETSQLRLTRAISILNDKDTIDWIDADGNTQIITKNDCIKLMEIAGKQQTDIFIKAAKLKKQIREANSIIEINKISW